MRASSVKSTDENSELGMKSTGTTMAKKDLMEQVSGITLNQLSIALSQKNNRKSEARCVALLSFYSLSINTIGAKSSILLLSPKLSKKGKSRDAFATICYLLTLTSKKHLDGNKKKCQGTAIAENCNMLLFVFHQ